VSKAGLNDALGATRKLEISENFLKNHPRKDKQDEEASVLLLRARRWIKKELWTIYKVKGA